MGFKTQHTSDYCLAIYLCMTHTCIYNKILYVRAFNYSKERQRFYLRDFRTRQNNIVHPPGFALLVTDDVNIT